MRVGEYDIVMMTKLKMMMKPLRDRFLQGLLFWREMAWHTNRIIPAVTQAVQSSCLTDRNIARNIRRCIPRRAVLLRHAVTGDDGRKHRKHFWLRILSAKSA